MAEYGIAAWREMMLWNLGIRKSPPPPDLQMMLGGLVSRQQSRGKRGRPLGSLSSTYKVYLVEKAVMERYRRMRFPDLPPQGRFGFFSQTWAKELDKRGLSVGEQHAMRQKAWHCKWLANLELERVVNATLKSAHRALSVQQRSVHIPADLAAAFGTLAKMAHRAGLLNLVERALELITLTSRLKLFTLGRSLRDRLERGPPLPIPIVAIPQAKPNAPGFSA